MVWYTRVETAVCKYFPTIIRLIHRNFAILQTDTALTIKRVVLDTLCQTEKLRALKTAKRLTTKAFESGTDLFIALLDWRNCPSGDLGASPVQLLMGRRTLSQLPTPTTLLSNNNNTHDNVYSAVIMTTRSLREFTRFI